MRIKKHENLAEANISKVIELLEGEKPITKKEACGMLNIAYNTTRLNKIIVEHNETMRFRAIRKAQNKGKGADPQEIKSTVQMYVDGFNVSDIAKSLYRSPAFIKGIIERLGVPQKLSMTDYDGRRNAILPDQCMADEFEIGEKVWCIHQNYPATIQREIQPEGEEERGYKLYLVYTIECTDQSLLSKTFFPHITSAGKYYPLPAYSIGSLKHLQQYL
jgi:hypothetical protein